MNHHLFIDNVTGNWIIQSSNYSLLVNNNLSYQYINKVTWTYIQEYDDYINLLLPNISEEDSLSNFKLYTVEYTCNTFKHYKYYVLFLYEQSQLLCLLKFNSQFTLINKFKINFCSECTLHMIAHNNGITIIEKIYYINSNLRVTKVIIQKNGDNIGTTFSSEIRIS